MGYDLVVIFFKSLFLKDFAYHGLAVLFFLSAGVDLAIVTVALKDSTTVPVKTYRTYISAVVSTI